MEALQPLEAAQTVTAISLRKLKRLYTPEFHQALLGKLHTKPTTLKTFDKGIEEVEWWQWTAWQWDSAPDSML